MKKQARNYIRRIGLLILLELCAFHLLLAQNLAVSPQEVSFQSNDYKIHGWFYQAKGYAPFPVVILLQGFPGKDGDLFELGQNLSKEGFNALSFNYSGTWKSEGIFLPETSLKSVQAAIDFLKSEQAVKTYSIDTSQIVLIGYSYGGGIALLASLYQHSLNKIISIAGGDLGVIAEMIEENPDFRKAHCEMLDHYMSDSTIARGSGGQTSHDWLLKNRDFYDLKKCAGKLAGKEILLIGGWLDHTIMLEDHILPLYRSLQESGATEVEIQVFETDHSFKNVRSELTAKIFSWLKK